MRERRVRQMARCIPAGVAEEPVHFERGYMAAGLHVSSAMNFNETPLLVIWETTQSCDLACVHCRASAMPERHCGELTTRESYHLLDQIRSFGSPLMVFTGGDPLKRPDLFELMAYSVKLGLRTNVSPSATPLLTIEAIKEFQRLGVARMAISLDGPDAGSHDAFRGVTGTFARAMMALRYAQLIGLETQIQTTVTRRNIGQASPNCRPGRGCGRQDVESLLPGGHRAGPVAGRPDCGGIRSGLRNPLRHLENRSVRCEDDRRDALPPLRGAARKAARG